MKEFNLHNYSKKNSFTTPTNYFDGVEDTIMQKIESNTEKPVKKLWNLNLYWFNGIAAAVLVVVGCVHYFNTNSISKIDQNALVNYLMINTTTEDITNQLSEKDIEELSKNILKTEEVREYVDINMNYYANWED